MKATTIFEAFRRAMVYKEISAAVYGSRYGIAVDKTSYAALHWQKLDRQERKFEDRLREILAKVKS